VTGRAAPTPESDAALAAALFATDPWGLGGVWLKGRAGPARDRWLALLRDYLPPGTPLRRLPIHVADSRLLGGLDLAATLRAGRPVAERGLLAETDGGVLLAAMAERMSVAFAAHLCAVLDVGEIAAERDGFTLRSPARLGVVALDESAEPEERPPAALCDRLALLVDLERVSAQHLHAPFDPQTVAAARRRLAQVSLDEERVAAVCAAALQLGIGSLRIALLAARTARVAAALAGRRDVDDDAMGAAARLALAPRATMLPASEPPPEQPEHDRDTASEKSDEQPGGNPDRPLEDRVLAAAAAAIPEGLLSRLRAQKQVRPSTTSGRGGVLQKSLQRGRPAGTRRGEPRGGARLDLVETLRAAAPWQRLRRADGDASDRILVRRDDLRVTRRKKRAETVTIFAVDASGSTALHRLAEAKGAVEMLLAECYVRRDQAALIAFRGATAEVLLPPTRSLARARRCLANLPGGGGTPLATAIDALTGLADAVRRKGQSPIAVLLTDGRANVTRDGKGGRAQAETDALAAARRARAAGVSALLVDTAPNASAVARLLADEMGARYLALPYADAAAISRSVQSAAAPHRAATGRQAARLA
jgi:magnesium chelatase subunit D